MQAIKSHMSRAIVERNMVVILFVLVLVIFSFAERDSRKIQHLYNTPAQSFLEIKKQQDLAYLLHMHELQKAR